MWWLIVIGSVLVSFALYLIGTRGPTDPRQRAEELESRYGVNVPWWLALWRRSSVNSRLKLLGDIKAENLAQVSLIATESEIQKVELESSFSTDRVKEKRELEIVTQSNVIARTSKGTDLNISVEALDQIRIEEEKSKLKIDERRQMKEVDKDVFQFEKEIDVKGAIIAKVVPVYEMNALTKQLEGELGSLEHWMSLPESYQQKQMVTQ